MLLDQVAQHQTDERSRGEGDEQTDEQSAPVLVASDGPCQQLHNAIPIQGDDGKNRAELNGDGVRVSSRLACAIAQSEEALGHEQMTRRRNRKELGHTLHGAKDHRFDRCERPTVGSHGNNQEQHARGEQARQLPPLSADR